MVLMVPNFINGTKSRKSQLPSLEQVRVIFRTTSNIYNETLCKNSKVNFQLLTIVAKRSALDALLGPEYALTSGYNTVLKIQTEILPWQQVKMVSFFFLFFLSHDICDSQDNRGRGRPFLVPLYHFHHFHQHWFSRTITTDKSPGTRTGTSGRSRTGNRYFRAQAANQLSPFGQLRSFEI